VGATGSAGGGGFAGSQVGQQPHVQALLGGDRAAGVSREHHGVARLCRARAAQGQRSGIAAQVMRILGPAGPAHQR
jgi:hypothetical protein